MSDMHIKPRLEPISSTRIGLSLLLSYQVRSGISFIYRIYSMFIRLKAHRSLESCHRLEEVSWPSSLVFVSLVHASRPFLRVLHALWAKIYSYVYISSYQILIRRAYLCCITTPQQRSAITFRFPVRHASSCERRWVVVLTSWSLRSSMCIPIRPDGIQTGKCSIFSTHPSSNWRNENSSQKSNPTPKNWISSRYGCVSITVTMFSLLSWRWS